MFAIRYGGVTRTETMYDTAAEAEAVAKRLYSPDMKVAINGPFIVRVRPELEVATSAIFQWCTTRSASDVERVVHSLPKEAAAGWQILVETKGGVGAYLVCARWPTPLGIREERIILYNRRLERAPPYQGEASESQLDGCRTYDSRVGQLEQGLLQFLVPEWDALLACPFVWSYRRTVLCAAVTALLGRE